MPMNFTAILITSLLGSLHCAGMCGGFVACCQSNTKSYSKAGWQSAFTHISYNSGRLSAYLLLGAIAGSLGTSLDSLGAFGGIQHITGIIMAVILIYWGYKSLKGRASTGSPLAQPASFASSFFEHLFSKRELISPEVFAYLLGLFSAFLPCGWLYLYVGYAASTGSPAFGALSMFAFWLGTLPMLLSLGAVIQSGSMFFKRFVPQLTAAVLIIAGFFSLSQHLHLYPLDKSASSHCEHHMNH